MAKLFITPRDSYKNSIVGVYSMPSDQQNLNKITWQSENCLSCKWFYPADPLNADILSNGKCLEPSLKKFELIVTGRDWCNKFAEITQTQIDRMQEKAMEKS